MNKNSYIILSGKNHPYFNMGCDEYLINLYEKYKVPIFRIYGWKPAGITIGNNQKTLQTLNIDACNDDGIIYVRRITGGSAIYHDDEITYSLILSDNDLEKHNNFKESYREICKFIHETYKKFGLLSNFSRNSIKYDEFKGLSNFCFSSWEEYDIIIDGKKIGGNAQKRSKNVILQHGSIPISLNYDLIKKYIKNTPDNIEHRTTSLNELLRIKVNFNLLQEIIIDSIKTTFKLDLKELLLTDTDLNSINNLIKCKYRSAEWNLNKNRSQNE